MANKLRRWLKDTDAFELGAIIFIIVGIILVVLALILGVNAKINLEGGNDWSNITQYSEFIAGLIGGIWSLAGVLLFYSSLTSQKADLEAQKDLLVKQIDEVVAQTKEFRIQNEMAKDQKNEETFFQLLRFHNEIITSIELEQTDVDFSTGENVTKTILGRKAFVEYYDIFKRFFGETSENISSDAEDNTAKLFDTCYNTFYLEYQADLGHYFRNLYNLLRYVRGVKKESQPFFLSLLIAQLSNYELTMLFFHCLRSTNSDFKTLVEEFEVLAQVPKDEVTSMAYQLYDIKAFGSDGFGSGDILDGQDLDDDFDTNSLLGQLTRETESIEEKSNDSPTGLGFMEDLLSRLKGAEAGTNNPVPEKPIEIEGDEDGDFLNDFFDRQEQEQEDKKSKLLVEKEKVEQKENELLDIESILSKSKN
ncbi:putative phage abortive infection protein, partial [Candidatus Kapabacteria bacterium]|nr:putative phage abortive infection protein [Candidatus Kapabacteria bacterium]